MFFRRHRVTSAIAIVIVLALVYLLGWSNYFTTKEIAYSGAPTKSSQLAVKKLADISTGERLARIETRKVSARIKTLPWIKSVDISRNWINGQVLVSVEARLPIATFNGQLMDAEGKRF